MPQRDIDLLMGTAFFLVGALVAVLLKAYLVATETEVEPVAVPVFVFGPGASEPERSASEARYRKWLEEHPGDAAEPDGP
jgi:hypothetical protein